MRGGGIVPGRFRDVSHCAAVERPVGRAYVSAEAVEESIVIRAAHRYVVGSGSEAADLLAVLRGGCDVEVIASGGAVVSGRNGDRYSLGCCLLPCVVEPLIIGCAEEVLALAEAQAEDVDRVVVDGLRNTIYEVGRSVKVKAGVGSKARSPT